MSKIIVMEVGKAPEQVAVQKHVSLETLQRYLGEDTVLTVVSRKIGNKWFDIWLDDEGLLKPKPYIKAICTNAHEVLCGTLLIAKHDSRGNTIGLTDEECDMVCVYITKLKREKLLNLCGRDGDEFICYIDYPSSERLRFKSKDELVLTYEG